MKWGTKPKIICWTSLVWLTELLITTDDAIPGEKLLILFISSSFTAPSVNLPAFLTCSAERQHRPLPHMTAHRGYIDFSRKFPAPDLNFSSISQPRGDRKNFSSVFRWILQLPYLHSSSSDVKLREVEVMTFMSSTVLTLIGTYESVECKIPDPPTVDETTRSGLEPIWKLPTL